MVSSSPDSWGDFGAIEELFDRKARAQAEADLDTLTLGIDAADTYEFVEPDHGQLAIDVLTGLSDKPAIALAFVKFM